MVHGNHAGAFEAGTCLCLGPLAGEWRLGSESRPGLAALQRGGQSDAFRTPEAHACTMLLMRETFRPVIASHMRRRYLSRSLGQRTELQPPSHTQETL